MEIVDLSIFDKILSSRELNKSKEKFKDKSYKEIILAAKENDIDAINIIFYNARKVILKAFYVYYLGPNKKYWKLKIDNGEHYIFISEIYNLLLDEKSPIKSFNPDIYKEYQLEDKLNYYIYRYAESLSFKLIKQNLGISGNLDKNIDKNFIVSSFEDYVNEKGELMLKSKDTSFQDIEIADTFSKYLVLLKNKYPKFYKVIKLKSLGFSIEDISNKLNVTKQTIYNILNKSKDIYLQFIDGKINVI